MVLTRSMVRTIKYNEDKIKDIILWKIFLKGGSITCDENCETRNMIGRSWYKCHGYNSPCICAFKSEMQRCNTEIMNYEKIINMLDPNYNWEQFNI
jgi:hypothetical protein